MSETGEEGERKRKREGEEYERDAVSKQERDKENECLRETEIAAVVAAAATKSEERDGDLE